eukprot:SM000065S20165  [mRNA]  locus=s65:124578:125544:+ [translate_table: standard]
MDEGAALPGALLDLVDDEWRADVLPDDDIPLPPGTEAPADDIEDPGQEHQAAGTDTWPDLGLHIIK